MLIAILQFDLHIRGAESLKDKRRVVSSVKDRLHREHLVSVAEVAAHDHISVARMGLALVTNDLKHAAVTLDRITSDLRKLHDAELGDVSREFLRGQGAEAIADSAAPGAVIDAGEIDRELMRYAQDFGEDRDQRAVASMNPPKGRGDRSQSA